MSNLNQHLLGLRRVPQAARWIVAQRTQLAGLFVELAGIDPLGNNLGVGERPLTASGLLEAFKKIWADSWRPRTEHILRNAFLALLDQPQATLADVLRLLGDAAFRKSACARTPNAHVRDFWLREYDEYPSRFRIEASAPIQNKVGAFLANPLLNRIVTQPKSSSDLRRVMDEEKSCWSIDS